MNISDLIGTSLGFFFTLTIFSYLLGDNPLFRLALHIFIGVAAGFAGIVAINSVILPQLITPLFGEDRLDQFITLVPLALSWLFLAKISPNLARWGNLPVAYLVGVGAAAAIGGAVTGLIFPQAETSVKLLDVEVARLRGINLGFYLVNGGVTLVGTLTTLAYFHFGARDQASQAASRRPWIEELAKIGQVFIAITLGFLFAGVLSAALATLIERLTFLYNFLIPLL
ncbi:MAG TPA: hypothetical protein VJ436_00345 [Anaerolineales bacterium]|nr:hypothetical protein [Anaerolineales bacterium]